MRTSFYFLFWILIYPILDIVGVPNGISFFVALGAMIVLNRILNSTMSPTLGFEKKLREMPMLSEVFEGDVNAFLKRLKGMRRLSLIGACYLVLNTLVLLYCVLVTDGKDWLLMLIFGYIALGSVMRTVKYSQLISKITDNPTAEECMNVACDDLNYDYPTYYEAMTSGGVKAYLEDKPSHFGIFQNVSMIIAVITSILGIITLISGAVLTLLGSYIAGFVAGTMLLYGGLAFYYGITDCLEIGKNKGLLKMYSSPCC
ncbi:MAG: hypothetical protein K2M62_09810 [Muribaculaceae bacterium]|nr:hypothetical protein [Muribaculaceae bacterium]